MLAFAVIISNSNFNSIYYTPSILSWYEEWLLYFEFMWGETCYRWEDVVSEMHYNLD